MKCSTMGLALSGSLLAAVVIAGCSGGVTPDSTGDSDIGERAGVGSDDRPDKGNGNGNGPSGKDPEDGQSGGDPPPPDGGDPPPPADDDPPPPDDDDPPTLPDDPGTAEVDDCSTLGYDGACVGAVSVWFEGGACRVRDCGAEDKVCGFISDEHGWGCLGGPGESPVDCSTLGYLGACMSETLVWVEDDACHAVHCPSAGQSCVWTGGLLGYDCQ